MPATDFISLKYFLLLLKGVFLKDISFEIAIELIMPMFALGIVSLIFAAWMFQKKVT
jgi:ABC-2 type transport system permease protein